ncbi:sulfatase-like hydrolase/transferase [Streptomyces sp. PgraA7]|uniref:sulfatase-like hydrolase/transferase n=1 Tax=unclassified Streptomyces TaxID=2593676 RepID=UPI000B506E24|nr:sulfatase-like hydrolase/transferase [Streptomyces sp. PgraA7]MYX00340.1 sulfatase-like hydrolase/transferase [Streptomyces sp. SID8378]
MKAVMVMFDSLNRHLLPPYGADWTHAPNFARLADRTVTYDRCYAGSMPCMPARRELHTGRHNFLHRGWGPLEPFDDSMPEILKRQGVHTHLVSDHQHYWEDGGATYHGRYTSWEFFRGQEGDAWKGQVADPEIPENLRATRNDLWRQDWVNRQYLDTEAKQPQTLTFDAGLEFLRTNHAEDDWFVQIETFDPHEPFFTQDHYKDLYPHDYEGPHFDWPDYNKVTETDEQVRHARYEYAALLSMCDHSLGRVLDAMDELGLWDDTLLIVCTDHGYLLGEKGWWAKVVTPWYNELVHTPLFVHDPRRPGRAGTRDAALVQTVDLAPTLLDFFGAEIPQDMRGRPLRETADGQNPRDSALFGMFGGHVNITDGRYVYMRACHDDTNQPLYEHTLMPTRIRGRFTPEELTGLTLAEPFPFTKGVPTLRIPARPSPLLGPQRFGTLLFDLETDPLQEKPISDPAVELRLARLLVERLRADDAPADQYTRLGLPYDPEDVTEAHLLVDAQRERADAGRRPAARSDEFTEGALNLRTPLAELLAEPAAADAVRRIVPGLLDTELLTVRGGSTLLQIAAFTGHPGRAQLTAVADELARLFPVPDDHPSNDGEPSR